MFAKVGSAGRRVLKSQLNCRVTIRSPGIFDEKPLHLPILLHQKIGDRVSVVIQDGRLAIEDVAFVGDGL